MKKRVAIAMTWKPYEHPSSTSNHNIKKKKSKIRLVNIVPIDKSTKRVKVRVIIQPFSYSLLMNKQDNWKKTYYHLTDQNFSNNLMFF